MSGSDSESAPSPRINAIRPLPVEDTSEQAQERLAADRRSTLVLVLDRVIALHLSTVDLLQIVDILGLDEELTELAGPVAEHGDRYARLGAATRLLRKRLDGQDVGME